MADKKIRVVVWNEFRHEKESEEIRKIYPDGLHAVIKEFLDKNDDMEVRLASLDDPDQGLPDEVLNNTDVLLWWGHIAHHQVNDELVAKIIDRVYRYGMGFIPLHSAHHSKVFKKMIGCTGDLRWGDNQDEIIWNINPGHPVAAGVPEHFQIVEELYGEPFYIPQPDEQIFIGWYEQGYVFRSGCVFKRGVGRICYLQPGHEECRAFYNPIYQRIITNAVRYVAPHGDFVCEYPEKCPQVGPVYEPKS